MGILQNSCYEARNILISKSDYNSMRKKHYKSISPNIDGEILNKMLTKFNNNKKR